MKIYNYEKNTKEFTTTTEAQANPLEKEKYLIPANATEKEPLVPKTGFAVCFDEKLKEWEYIEDNRGKEVYSILDKNKTKIDYLGAIKEGFTIVAPKQFDKWDDIQKNWIEDKNLKRQSCLNLLESTFEQKTVEIKAIACDKTGSNEYIKSQYEIYETMYSNAKASYYSAQLNEEIITANKTAKQLTAPMIILVNEIRHEFQRLITFEVEVKKELELFRDTPISKTDNTSLNQLHTKLKGM